MILSCLIETVNNFRILELQDKVLCRVCFERDIAVVLIPCRHRILCRFDTLTLDIHLAVTFADSIFQSRLSETWVTSNFDFDYFVKSLLFSHHFAITFLRCSFMFAAFALRSASTVLFAATSSWSVCQFLMCKYF